MKSRALQVTFLAFVLITSCNKDDFYGVSVQVRGADAQCSAGTDIPSCEAIQGCQVALEDVESMEPVFASCVANPSDPNVVVIEPPSNPSTPTPPAPPAPPVVEEEKIPTVKDAYETNCEKLDEKYLIIKKYMTAEGEEKVSKKVKVCHMSCPTKGPHAIIVACPSLKAHISHEDYLGACKED